MEQPTTTNKYVQKLKTFAQEAWWFITSGIFLKNCAGIMGFIFAFVWMTTFWLKCYTDHGESLEVPDFIGMTLDEAKKKAKNRGFNLVASDSTSKPGMPAFTIFEQNPKARSRVKEDRTIYLSITKAVMDNVTLPDIAGGNDDFEQYSKKLETQEVNVEVIARRFDAILEANTIMDVIFDGDTITNNMRYGVKVPKGSTVYFVVSERENSNIQIPDLICNKVEAAKFLISTSNLMVGNVIGDNSVIDPEEAYVWKQEPAYQVGSTLRIGEQITIYITAKKPDGCLVTEE